MTSNQTQSASHMAKWPCLLLICLSTIGSHKVWSAEQRTPRPPNVLFLFSDDQRPDTIGAWGNSVIETPNLDKLARRGVSLPRAVCTYPLCVPSRGEIFTGRCTFRNNMSQLGERLDPQPVLWPEAMRAAGYHTWHVGKWHVRGRPTERGFEQSLGLFSGGGGRWAKDEVDWKGSPITGYKGWVFQDDEGNLQPERGVGLTPNISSDFADAAIELIRRKPERPFFLHVNFTAPHDPLLMPPGYEGRYRAEQMPLPANFLPEHPFDHGNARGRDEQLLPWPRTEEMIRDVLAVYYTVITHMDEQIGRILQALEETDQADRTIVVFTADNGLAVGSHGLRGKQNMYEHTVGVPLIMSGPGIPQGETRCAQVYLRDLYPTVCELTGVEIPSTVESRSFAGVLTGEVEQIHPFVFCYFRDSQRMIRGNRWKLIHYPQLPKWQLFDLDRDPDELHNLAGDPQYADVRRRWERELRRAQKECDDPLLAP